MLEGFHEGDEWTEMITESLSSIWREPFSLKKDLSSLQALCPILHTVPVPSAAPHMFQCPFMPWMPFCPCEGARTASLQLYGEESWFQRDSMLNWDSILISLWTQGPRSPDLLCSYYPSCSKTLGTIRKHLSIFYSRVVWAHTTSSKMQEAVTRSKTWSLCCLFNKVYPLRSQSW